MENARNKQHFCNCMFMSKVVFTIFILAIVCAVSVGIVEWMEMKKNFKCPFFASSHLIHLEVFGIRGIFHKLRYVKLNLCLIQAWLDVTSWIILVNEMKFLEDICCDAVVLNLLWIFTIYILKIFCVESTRLSITEVTAQWAQLVLSKKEWENL